MKSFIVYPFELELIASTSSPDKSTGKLIAHYELFKKVKHLNGAIVKCGVSAEEGFSRFTRFKEVVGPKFEQKMIAFQKFQPVFEEVVNETGEVSFRVKRRGHDTSNSTTNHNMVEIGQIHDVDFIPGDVSESIPEYLIENPELKIALLNLDLDDYEGTTNALEFLYPRLVQGGILILDNYYKNMAEKKAVDEYFGINLPKISNFSISKGPHYFVKQ